MVRFENDEKEDREPDPAARGTAQALMIASSPPVSITEFYGANMLWISDERESRTINTNLLIPQNTPHDVRV